MKHTDNTVKAILTSLIDAADIKIDVHGWKSQHIVVSNFEAFELVEIKELPSGQYSVDIYRCHMRVGDSLIAPTVSITTTCKTLEEVAGLINKRWEVDLAA